MTVRSNPGCDFRSGTTDSWSRRYLVASHTRSAWRPLYEICSDPSLGSIQASLALIRRSVCATATLAIPSMNRALRIQASSNVTSMVFMAAPREGSSCWTSHPNRSVLLRSVGTMSRRPSGTVTFPRIRTPPPVPARSRSWQSTCRTRTSASSRACRGPCSGTGWEILICR